MAIRLADAENRMLTPQCVGEQYDQRAEVDDGVGRVGVRDNVQLVVDNIVRGILRREAGEE